MPRTFLLGMAGIAACALLATGAWASGQQQKEVVLTCQKCESSPTNVFFESRYEVVQAFNKQYAGRYRIDVQHYGGKDENDLSYMERLALANAMPDIFVAQSTQLQTLAKTGKMMDFAPFLAKDAEWANSFYPDAFTSLKSASGQVWGIPEERDVVGIYYNKALFAKAGISAFPATWDEFLADCQKLKAAHVIPVAMDGDWVTQLMWANLIGTQPGGEQFLTSGIAKGGFSDNPIVVKATEFLKNLHTSGYVNQDAFTGDYPNAANPFLQEQAAMIANGPWMVQADITGKSALPDLRSQVGYEISPGWTTDGRGAIVLAGNAGWGSGSRDPAKQEAVAAFTKFTTSPAIQLQRTLKTGAYWAVKLTLTPDQVALLEPLTYSLVSSADKAKYHYPHAKFATTQPFTDAWKNYWPGYVQGTMSTKEFLDKLSAAEQ